MKGRLVTLTALIFVLLGSTAVSAFETQIPVRTTKAAEYEPAAETGYFGWEQSSVSAPQYYNAYVQPDGQSSIRLNAREWQGAMGGIEGTKAVFQQYRPSSGASDIKFFNLVTKRRSNPPSGVNTKAWEYWPDIDANWLMFGRISSTSDAVMLFDLSTHHLRTVAKVARGNGYVDPAQVHGDYLVYRRCNQKGSSCDVFRYDIPAKTTVKIPHVKAFQVAPSVATDGTVYFVRSGLSCSSPTLLMRRSPSGSTVALAPLGSGWFSTRTYVRENADGSVEVFFDRWNACGPGRGNIYKVIDSFTLTVATDGTGSGTITSVPSGIDCGAGATDCTGIFGGGEQVTLTPTPDSTSVFDHWSGDCAGSGACSVTMDQLHSVTATFTSTT